MTPIENPTGNELIPDWDDVPEDDSEDDDAGEDHGG